jgi:hypothetical protein
VKESGQETQPDLSKKIQENSSRRGSYSSISGHHLRIRCSCPRPRQERELLSSTNGALVSSHCSPREWHFPFSKAAGCLRRPLLLDQNGSLVHPNLLRRGAQLPIVAIGLEGVEIRGASQRFPVSTLLFSFLAEQPCSVTISRWSAAGRFALVSRFDGKAEGRLVAENMLKIERQAV